MKHQIQYTVLIFTVFLLSSCLKEDHFGKSSYNTLYQFVLENQVGDAIIDQNTLLITCSMDSTADINHLSLQSAQLSNFATVSPAIGEYRDYTDTVEVYVTAENGDSKTYKVILQAPKLDVQIANSDFQQWYDSGNGYPQIGNAVDPLIWTTGNAGAILAGNIPTYPEVIGDNDSIAILETMRVLIGPRIAAGSLFTGLFELNISNPPASIKPGIPFTGKPSGFQLDIKYSPGEENLDGDGNPLSYDDEADIYVLLEVRSGEEVKRLATAWYRSSDAYTDWHSLELDLVYGALDASYPDYMKPADGQYAEATESPTHISIIMSSSAGGGEFAGAIDSKLQVNNFELVYD